VPEDDHQDSVISFGPFRLFPKSRLLEKDGAQLHIGGRALDILIVLAKRPGEVVGKRELVKSIWADVHVDEGSLRFHVAALRKVLGDAGKSARYVVNVPGRGYCFAAPLAHPASSAAPAPVQAAARASLPPSLARMIGRDDVIDRISSGLSLHRFITVVGPGGIGKTAVAVTVAHRRSADFAGQVFFIDFGPLRDPTLVATAIASAVGLAVGADDPLPALLANLQDKRTLLIFDSCEHVLEILAPLAERLIRDVPQLHVLATSRESFRSEGERIFRLFPLDCPPRRDDLGVGEILAYPAAQLFVDRIAQGSGPLELSREDASLVADICRRLDGIALAIELAASRVNAYGIAGTASLLDSRFSLQWRGRRTAIPRHQTLSAALDWSYDLLSASEGTILRRLSVFVGSFTPEAAAAVASGDGLSPSETSEAIDNLVTKSLIVTSGRTLRYRLLDMTRTYAHGKLAASGEERHVAQRHAEYFRHLLTRAETETSAPLHAWLNTYAGELDNVRAALDWAFSADGNAALGIALTAATVTLWVRLSLFAECRERARTALAVLDDNVEGVDRLRMQLLAALGWSLMYGEGRAREARPILEATHELADRLDDKDFRLRALWGLCIDQFNNGEFGKARALADRFTIIAASSPDETDLMLADRLMAVALHYLGDQTDAAIRIDRVNASLHVLTEKPKIFPLDLGVSTQYFRARILWLRGSADQALELAARNIEEGRANGHALTFCSVLGQSACLLNFFAGDYDAAKRHGVELLGHADRHAVRPWSLWARAFNAMIIARSGDIATGLPLLREELERAGDTRFLPRFLPLLGELAACFGEAGQTDRGLAAIEDVLKRCDERQERWYLPELIRIKGELMLRDAEQSAGAEACFREAMAIAAQQGANFWQLRCAISIARIKMTQSRKEEAADVLEAVCKQLTEGANTADLRMARGLITQLQRDR